MTASAAPPEVPMVYPVDWSLLPRVIKAVSKDEDLVVFCGTVPIIDGQFRPGSQFDCRLSVPGSDPIDLSYATRTTAASAPVAD
jgi:hypothetical protein